MRFQLKLPALFACVLGAAMIGCSAEAPSSLPPTGRAPDGGTVTDPHHNQQPDLLPPDTGPVDPPMLDAIPQTTQYDTIPVHGSAKPNSSVLIQSAAGTVSTDVLSSGRFCLDLALQKNTMNHFQLATIDSNGNESDPVTLDVNQTGDVQQAVATPTSENLSIGGALSSSLGWDTGSAVDAIDGDAGTSAGARQGSFSTTDNVVVQLAERHYVNRLHISAPSSCPLTAHFQVFVSNADAPSAPAPMVMGWTQVADVTNAPGAEYDLPLPQAVIMNHVAIYFDRGWVAWGASDINCGSDFLGAYYGFAEIQAWSVPNVQPPPPVTPSCRGGN